MTVCNCSTELIHESIIPQFNTCTMSLTLSAAMEKYPDVNTRSIDGVYEGNETNYNISVYIIFQFDNNGERIVDPVYYKYKTDSPDGSQNIPIVIPPDGAQNTILVLANTHDELPNITFADATNIDKLLNKYQLVKGIEDTYKSSESSKELMMNGFTTITSKSHEINIELYRNVAKFTLQLTNNEGSGLIITQAQIKGIASKIDYFTHYIEDCKISLYDPPYPGRQFKTIDYETDLFTLSPGETLNLHYYLPCHLMGTSASLDEKTKGNYAPENSTYVEICGKSANDSEKRIVRYRFFIGANNMNDYNIKANYHYTLPVIFNGFGNPETDPRVEIISTVSMLEEANCYIINPLSTEEQIMYNIPVANRVNRFWHNEYIAGHIATDTGCTLTNENEWSIEILWQTSDQQLVEFYGSNGDKTDSNGRKYPVYKGFDPLTLKPVKGAKGNMLIGIYRTDQDIPGQPREYLWSYHLWITDYTPDEAKNENWNGKYKLSLKNSDGEVHYYKGTLWDTTEAPYYNKWMMDRNLGALGCDGFLKDYEGLYYQFGRKDPFVNSTNQLYTYQSSDDTFIKKSIPNSTSYTSKNTITYNTKHPTDYVGSSTVVHYENPYASNLWDDPDWNKNLHEGKTNKSYFDPCPPGWRLPTVNVWDGIKNSIQYDSSKNGYIVYYDGIKESSNTTMYHAGYANFSRDIVYTYVMTYCASPYNNNTAYFLATGVGGASFGYPNYARAYGGPVRCIQE